VVLPPCTTTTVVIELVVVLLLVVVVVVLVVVIVVVVVVVVVVLVVIIVYRCFSAIHSMGQWTIRYNYELQTMYEDVDNGNVIGVRRLNWIGHINQMDDTTKVKQIF
jgi:hypothetical protein